VKTITDKEYLFYKSIYEEMGVVRIPEYFSKTEIDVLRAQSFFSLRTARAEQIQWRGIFPALLFGPAGMSSYRKDISPVIQNFLGDDVLQLVDQYYFRLPGDGDQFAPHQDISFRIPPEKFDRIESGYLQTAIIVDRMDEGNGGIEFVIGSHKEKDLGLIPRDGSEKGLRKYSDLNGEIVVCDPGDLLLWSAMIVHGSRPNNSSRHRAYLMNGFAKAECVKSTEFHKYLIGGKYAGY
jgi:ectoine hydroxylase-related dioxygenase (phytanoyl-CoA dioxygenase family)